MNPSKLTVWEILRALTPGEFWTAVVAIGAILCTAFGFGYFLRSRQLELKDERIQTLTDRIALKGEQLDEYRKRAGIITATGTAFSKLSNNALKQKALDLVETLRTSLEHYNRTSRGRLFAEKRAELGKATDNEQRASLRKEAWESMINKDREAWESLFFAYHRHHKVNAILLRDEILPRIGKTLQPDGYDYYANPVNPLGLEDVISDLEAHAKNLREENTPKGPADAP